jgi:hypothetical protein
MSRVTCWIMCSAFITITILYKDASAPVPVLVGFYFLVGIPLFLHWLMEIINDRAN